MREFTERLTSSSEARPRRSILPVLLDDLEEAILQPACRLVEGALDCSVERPVRTQCDLPMDMPRNQRSADMVLEGCVLPFRSAAKWVVGLTGVDLYSAGLNFVFGLADTRTGCAVVSWRRLVTDPSVWVKRLAKEIVHEVGHLYGLHHCGNPQCVMWFSNTLAETDRKDLHFCLKCQAQL